MTRRQKFAYRVAKAIMDAEDDCVRKVEKDRAMTQQGRLDKAFYDGAVEGVRRMRAACVAAVARLDWVGKGE